MAPQKDGKSHICPIDKKAFATKKALAQHRADAHKASSQSGRGRGRRVGAPRSLGPVSNSRTISGTDILNVQVISGGAIAGTVIAGGTLFPNFMEDTRLYAEAQLWARWRPKSLRMDFVSSAGAMTSGSYLVGWSMDPDQWIPDGMSAIRTVAAMKPSKQVHISRPLGIAIPCIATQRWYVMDDKADLVDKAHGKWFVVLTGSIGNVTGGSDFTLSINLTYTVEFDTPNLPVAISSGNKKAVYADAGYESYFTDSDSGWADGKYCTLKHAAGGTMVTFSNLEDGTIYQLDTGAKLFANSTTTPVAFMTKIIGHDAHVVVFQTLSKAREYLRTKSLQNNAIPYTKTGVSVTPSNPAWFVYEVTKGAQVSVERLDRLEKLLEDALTLKIRPSYLASRDVTLNATVASQTKYLDAFRKRFEDVTEDVAGKGVVNVVGLADLQSQADWEKNSEPEGSRDSSFSHILDADS